MNKKAYRIQGAIVFLFIAVISACNALRAITHIPLNIDYFPILQIF